MSQVGQLEDPFLHLIFVLYVRAERRLSLIQGLADLQITGPRGHLNPINRTLDIYRV